MEHAFLTPVFGAAQPPRGVSGAIRKYSYATYSEGRAAHWLLRLIPGIAGNAAVSAVDVPTGESAARRRRRALRAIVRDGRADEVVAAYDALDPTDDHRSARIDMLETLADHDRDAAEPVGDPARSSQPDQARPNSTAPQEI